LICTGSPARSLATTGSLSPHPDRRGYWSILTVCVAAARNRKRSDIGRIKSQSTANQARQVLGKHLRWAVLFQAILDIATFMNSRVKFFVVFASTSLVALLLVGAVIGRSASPDGPYHHLAVYTEVLSRIKSEYVEEPDMKSVTLGALNGLLESIDPFASYLNADQYKEYLKKKDAYKGDVGLVLSKRAGYVAVV